MKNQDRIFRMERKDGKLFRVMYFKNDKGNFVRSKFIKEVKSADNKKRGPKPKQVQKSKPIQTQTPPTSKPVQKQQIVKRSGASQALINSYSKLGRNGKRIGRL